MIEGKQNELDAGLKTKTANFFWHMGYLTWRNVMLRKFDFGSTKGNDITDIDVLCLSHNFDFFPTKIIIDCKTGTSTKTKERLLWVSGLSKYFNADRTYFVRDRISHLRYLDVSQKLGVTVLSEEDLDNLKVSYSLPDNVSVVCTENSFRKCTELKKKVKDINRPAFDYIDTLYFTDEAHIQIINLNEVLKIISNSTLSKGNKRKIMLLCLPYLASSVLTLIGNVTYIAPSKRGGFVKELIAGAETNYSRKDLISAFYEFMYKEIKEKYGKKYDVSKKSFMSSFYPEYTSQFEELVHRITTNPIGAKYSPLLLELIACSDVMKSKITVKDLPKSLCTDIVPESIRATKDFITFVERANMIDEENKKYLFAKLDEIKQIF